MRVVLATHNPHKVAEFQQIVQQTRPDLEVVGYDGPEPVEDGVTFAENALLKARAAAAHTGLAALADDSGICVDVLGGSPGVFSAYWAGQKKDAAANLELLLDQLRDIADRHRSAHFTSTIALVLPDGREHVVEGSGQDGSPARRREPGFRVRPDLHPGRSAGRRTAHGRGVHGEGEAGAVASRPRLRRARAAARRALRDSQKNPC